MRLYVHVPFCVHKCHYCDFNSHVLSEHPWQKYGESLVAEISHYAGQPQFAGRTIESIFFGGGTPSLAPPQMFADVLTAVKEHFKLSSDAEITLEANPGASEAERFQAYRALGLNRISIGVQSFDATELKWLERIHSADEAERALVMAREAGFDNINLDLMYALPNQTFEDWFVSLNRAIALAPEHLSCYQLTVEPHTKLHAEHQKKSYHFPDEELALDFFWQTRNRLVEVGYEAYEISNFAKKGRACSHNCGYWRYDDYIGVGAGASGKWDVSDGGVYRYSNIRSPYSYMESALQNGRAVQSDEQLDLDAAMGESVWLALRQREGVSLPWFYHRFDKVLLEVFPDEFKRWLKQGMLIQEGDFLKLTDKGLSLADEVAASFL